MLHRIRSRVAAISAQALLKITLKRASCEIEVGPKSPRRAASPHVRTRACPCARAFAPAAPRGPRRAVPGPPEKLVQGWEDPRPLAQTSLQRLFPLRWIVTGPSFQICCHV